MGYRIVRMNRQMFEEFFTEGWTCPSQDNMRIRCTSGLPQGAKLVAVSMGLWCDSGDIVLKFSHPSWEEEEPCQAIRYLDPCYVMEVLNPPSDETRAALRAVWEKRHCGPGSDSPHIVSGGES